MQKESIVVVGIPESLLVRIIVLLLEMVLELCTVLSSLSLEARCELGNELHLLMTSSFGASSSKLLESAIRCHD